MRLPWRRPTSSAESDALRALRDENASLRAELLHLGGMPAALVEASSPKRLVGASGRKSCASSTRRLSGASQSESGMCFPDHALVPLPPLIPNVRQSRVEQSPAPSNTHVLEQLCQLGAEPDPERAMVAARRIRDPNYTLRQYHDDVSAAFPELGWYMVQIKGREGASTLPLHETEYWRTIGALFAVYWLVRIGIDGERGFSFGVDENWVPHEQPVAPPPRGAPFGSLSAEEKRVAFYVNTPWDQLQALMVDAGVLERVAGGEVRVAPTRMVALLVQTAIHDVMKMDILRPTVAAEHAPYLGFAAGDTINDHDAALAYVLDHYGDLLPSFDMVEAEARRAIRFAQARIAFNHGWLVQAEAPPSATFAPFKACISSRAVEPRDVAFYFAHWLTDLAGAEPTPMRGSEKFTLKFPHRVLASFIGSFHIVEQLATCNETEVLESYLRQRWAELPDDWGGVPDGLDSVPLMRLTVQAQHEAAQRGVFGAYWRLDERDVAVLRREMAQTGLCGQHYTGAQAEEQLFPAFLIYYSPALLQASGASHADEALRLLAEVYRRARQLWPASKEAVGGTVTIRIDAIKDLAVEDIYDSYTYGDSWVLTRLNDLEGTVERVLHDVPCKGGRPHATLEFWRRRTR
eukprot:scaffold200806_cov31-Tisochrysis_lutea.AAC.1